MEAEDVNIRENTYAPYLLLQLRVNLNCRRRRMTLRRNLREHPHVRNGQKKKKLEP